jgi:hypothetical protein
MVGNAIIETLTRLEEHRDELFAAEHEHRLLRIRLEHFGRRHGYAPQLFSLASATGLSDRIRSAVGRFLRVEMRALAAWRWRKDQKVWPPVDAPVLVAKGLGYPRSYDALEENYKKRYETKSPLAVPDK